jgi:hypothetical protein
MILWSLLVGVLLVAVLHRLDLAVEPTARSAARGAEKGMNSDPASAGNSTTSGLPDPVHLAVPPASGLAASTCPHRRTPVAIVSLARQLTRRLIPRKF